MTSRSASLVAAALLAALAVAGAAWWTADPRPAQSRELAAHTGEDAEPRRSAALPDPAPSGADAAQDRRVTAAPRGPDKPSADAAGNELLRVRGTVTSSLDSAPVGGLTFELRRAGADPVGVATDADGRFSTERVVAPGLVTLVHVADPSRAELAARLDLSPPSWIVRADEDGETQPLEITLLLPERWLELAVRRPDGAPAAGALVQLWWSRGDLQGPAWPLRANADGIARLPLRGDTTSLKLSASDADSVLAETVEVSPPWPSEPVELALTNGAALRVSAVDSDGAPLPDCEVIAGRDLSWVRARTDERGEARVAPLVPGPTFVRVRHEASGASAGASVNAAGDSPAWIEIELPAAPQELAAAGVVLDEDGAPLAGVPLSVSGRPEWGPSRSVSDERGRFELLATRAPTITVAAPDDFAAGVFEPASTSVPFGTRDVVIRRVRSDPPLLVALEIRDAETGTLVPEARGTAATASTAGGRRGSFAAPGGRAVITGRAYPDLSLTIAAPGYRTLHAPFDDLSNGTDTVVVRLERGYSGSFEVLDQDTLEPVRGARVLAGETLVAQSDADGVAEFELAATPERLSFSHPGYETLEIEPTSSETVWLVPRGR